VISKKYSEFLPSMQSAQDLVTQVDKLSDDIGLLKSRIETEVRTVCYVGWVCREKVQLPDSKDNSVYNFFFNLHFKKKKKTYLFDCTRS